VATDHAGRHRPTSVCSINVGAASPDSPSAAYETRHSVCVRELETTLREINEVVQRQLLLMDSVIAVTGHARRDFERLTSGARNGLAGAVVDGFNHALSNLDFANGLLGNVELALKVYASVIGVELSPLVPEETGQATEAVTPAEPTPGQPADPASETAGALPEAAGEPG
jgi:hypothetical protein